MSFRKKGLSLVVAALGVSLLGLSQFANLEAAPGRDFPRCVQSCNETRSNCRDACPVDCADLYPNDPAAQDMCVSSCDATCIDQSQECKSLCQNLKDPSPDGGGEEP
jgi:hypothetical protein